jgi:hypothetical protein
MLEPDGINDDKYVSPVFLNADTDKDEWMVIASYLKETLYFGTNVVITLRKTDG